MHKYLRSIGFSEIKNRRELKKVLNHILTHPKEKQYVSSAEGSILVEYRWEIDGNIGIAVCGEYSDDIEFDYDFYYPYFKGSNVSSTEDVSMDRYSDKEAYAGVCDDLKIGITLIFYLQNRLDYLKYSNQNTTFVSNTSLNLAGLSISGSIMLPLQKSSKDIQNTQKAEQDRDQLLRAARDGDESAIENLTLEDIETYSEISKKILDEDVLSLVDTYIMPYGIECDKYSVLGEIVGIKTVENSLTKESIYIINTKCNDLMIDICINTKDLMGEPALHRRFKGIIWLQGHINFEASGKEKV